MWIQLRQAYFGKSVGERIDCDEAHATMLVDKGIAEPVQGNPLDDVINKGMTSLVEGLTKGIDAAIQDALKSFRSKKLGHSGNPSRSGTSCMGPRPAFSRSAVVDAVVAERVAEAPEFLHNVGHWRKNRIRQGTWE